MKPLPPTFALNCPNDCWLVVAPHYDPPDLRPAALATGGLCAHRRGQRRAPRAAAAARGALYSEMARMTDRMTLIIKHEAVKDTGSFEVRFRDGRPSVFFYWDEVASRRGPDMLTSEQAQEQARAFAKAERDKGRDEVGR